MKKRLLTIFLAAGLTSAAANASPVFSGGIPGGWSSLGNAGTDGSDGVVGLAPGSTTPYGWVSTYKGVNGVGLQGIGGSGNATTGSTLTTSYFSVGANTSLSFYFNYVTSDGAGFADYGWARLLDGSGKQVALLFTARTTPGGNSVPGFSMPAPDATLTPGNVGILTGTGWSPLGPDDSGKCYDIGCGHTGWIHSVYNIMDAGSYALQFGVVNWNDQLYQSGLAFDGILAGGKPIEDLPEPASLALIGMGLLGFGLSRRRNKRQ